MAPVARPAAVPLSGCELRFSSVGRCFAATALTLAAASLVPSMASSACDTHDDAERTTHRALAWRDFKATRRPSGLRDPSVVAYVSTSIVLEPLRFELTQEPDGSWTARAREICARAFLLKEGSGYRPRRVSADDLAHEQGHFDITEIFARALAARLGDLAHRAPRREAALEGAGRVADSIVEQVLAEWRAAQTLYDEESCDAHDQVRWQRWIAAKLHGRTNLAALELPSGRAVRRHWALR